MSEIFKTVIDIFLHLDKNLAVVIGQYGTATYGFLFLIIFMETGLVITPFLPGDSLLFASGALAVTTSLNIWVLYFLLLTAAIIGDTVNYWIGHFFGQQIIANPKIPINQEHIDKTNQFFERQTIAKQVGSFKEAGFGIENGSDWLSNKTQNITKNIIQKLNFLANSQINFIQASSDLSICLKCCILNIQ